MDLKDLDCFLRIYFRFDPDKCALDLCPLECRTIQYDLAVSSLILTDLNEHDSMNISLYEEYRAQTLKIRIFYSQLEHTLIEETPAMSLTSLVANLGGTMGLIVSVSFFTFVEICELVLVSIYEKIRNSPLFRR